MSGENDYLRAHMASISRPPERGGTDSSTENVGGAKAPPSEVDRPAHYTFGAVECIDGIDSALTHLTGREAFYTGQIIKYVWRWKLKGGIQDLEKCKWYLERLIGVAR